jgi:hypothetical protein
MVLALAPELCFKAKLGLPDKAPVPSIEYQKAFINYFFFGEPMGSCECVSTTHAPILVVENLE